MALTVLRTCGKSLNLSAISDTFATTVSIVQWFIDTAYADIVGGEGFKIGEIVARFFREEVNCVIV